MPHADLIDRHGRTHRSLRISVIDKCDLRCTYCMPHDQTFLPKHQLMSREEILQLARIFVEEHGITKIRITGGEPLVRQDVSEIVGDLSALPVKLGLTTNALSLHKYIDPLWDAGLRSINVSLDTLDAQRFLEIARRDGLPQVIRNIELALKKGFRIKINMVVMRGINEDEILKLVSMTKDHDLHVRFIEFMPFDGNGWGREKVFTYAEMLAVIAGQLPIEKLKDDPHSTAKAYRVIGWRGTFAVISTVTEPFCGDCDRLRITAEGRMRNCLFSREETDLLSALRRGEDVHALIRSNVLAKHKMLGGLPPFEFDQEKKITADLSKRPMVSIGG